MEKIIDSSYKEMLFINTNCFCSSCHQLLDECNEEHKQVIIKEGEFYFYCEVCEEESYLINKQDKNDRIKLMINLLDSTIKKLKK